MNEKPTHLDLFSGIGGFTIAFESEGFQTIAYSEINPDKCLVYEYWFPGVPNLGAIETIRADELRASFGTIDVITGGVPCQPSSALGQMRGTADERWLWPEAIRLVREVRPHFAVFENPPSLLILEGGRAWNGIVSGLVALGYDCLWDVFPAAAFGAGHLRERILLIASDSAWCGRASHGARQHGASNQNTVADADNLDRRNRTGRADGEETDNYLGESSPDSSWNQAKQRPESSINNRPEKQTEQAWAGCRVGHVADTDRSGLQGHSRHEANGKGWTPEGRPVASPDLRGRVNCSDWWHETHTGVPVLAYGISGKLAEASARCAGDAVVPQVVRPIAKAIYQTLMR